MHVLKDSYALDSYIVLRRKLLPVNGSWGARVSLQLRLIEQAGIADGHSVSVKPEPANELHLTPGGPRNAAISGSNGQGRQLHLTRDEIQAVGLDVDDMAAVELSFTQIEDDPSIVIREPDEFDAGRFRDLEPHEQRSAMGL